MKEFLYKFRRWLFPGSVLLILAGLGLIWVGLIQTHTVIVAGDARQVRTPALRVSGVLRAAGVSTGGDDRMLPQGDPWVWAPAAITIEPAREVIIRTSADEVSLHSAERIPANLLASVGVTIYPHDRVMVNGAEIDPNAPLPREAFILLQVAPAMPVYLVMDGREMTLFTDQHTLGAALETANIPISPQDWVSVDLRTPLDNGLSVTIRRARPVRVQVGDAILTGLSAGTTVSEALADLGVQLQNLDQVSPPEEDPIPADGEIEVLQVEEQVIILKDEVPYQNVYVEDPETVLDQVSVVEPGQPGIYATRERVQYAQGEEIWRAELESWQASEAADGVLGYGSRVEVRTEVVDGQEIEYWRKISVYATSYSPCNLGLADDRCGYTTASGLPLQKGVIGVTRNWFNMMRGQQVYVQGYGRATVADIGGGGLYFNHYWIDLGYSEEDYQRWHHWTTMYFLTPVPGWYPAVLPWP